MAYFIFNKDSDNIDGSIYKIAENEFDLNNLNIIKNDYKIIEDSEINFNEVRLGIKNVVKYNNNTITYTNSNNFFSRKDELQICIDSFKEQIKQFTNNNPNHQLFSKWNDYYNQLNNLNLDNIIYPLNKSLEQYFNDLGQLSLNTLQLP
jgi:hypothetical protein